MKSQRTLYAPQVSIATNRRIVVCTDRRAITEADEAFSHACARRGTWRYSDSLISSLRGSVAPIGTLRRTLPSAPRKATFRGSGELTDIAAICARLTSR